MQACAKSEIEPNRRSDVRVAARDAKVPAVSFDRLSCRPDGARSVLVHSGELVLALLAEGEGVLATTSRRFAVDTRQMVLLGRAGCVKLTVAQPTAVLIVRFDRAAVQIAAGRLSGEPKRLASCNLAIRMTDRACSVFETLVSQLDGADRGRAEAWMVDWLAGTIRDDPRGAEMMQPASAIIRAMAHLRDSLETGHDLEAAAAAAGVPLRALRAEFRASLGMSLAAYSQGLRIAQAHASLSSGRDSRQIAEVASALGFASAGSFARAYARTYGETPTQTRVREVSARSRVALSS